MPKFRKKITTSNFSHLYPTHYRKHVQVAIDPTPTHSHSPPTTLQLTIPTTRNRRIIRLQHTRLRLIRLTKRIPTLLTHTLHLPNFANRLLELLHPMSN